MGKREADPTKEVLYLGRTFEGKPKEENLAARHRVKKRRGGARYKRHQSGEMIPGEVTKKKKKKPTQPPHNPTREEFRGKGYELRKKVVREGREGKGRDAGGELNKGRGRL